MGEHGPLRGHAPRPPAPDRPLRRRPGAGLSPVPTGLCPPLGGRTPPGGVQCRPADQPVRLLPPVRPTPGPPVRPIPRRRPQLRPAGPRLTPRPGWGVLPRHRRIPLPDRSNPVSPPAVVPGDGPTHPDRAPVGGRRVPQHRRRRGADRPGRVGLRGPARPRPARGGGRIHPRPAGAAVPGAVAREVGRAAVGAPRRHLRPSEADRRAPRRLRRGPGVGPRGAAGEGRGGVVRRAEGPDRPARPAGRPHPRLPDSKVRSWPRRTGGPGRCW